MNSVLSIGIAMRRRVFGAIAVAIIAHANAAEAPKSESNTLGMKLIQIPAGRFEQGVTNIRLLRSSHSNTIELSGDLTDDRPAHPVQLTKPYWIAAHEVTVGQFRAFVESTQYKTDAEKSGQGALAFHPPDTSKINRFVNDPKCTWRNPRFAQTDNHPVVCVSWKDAVAFCEWLSKKENAKYRLPTEAEWEYAARAGSNTIYTGGDKPESVREYGNIGDATLEAAFPGTVRRQQADHLQPSDGDGFVFTAPVGQFKPNAWGLYDTHGNAWEWCSDKYYDRYYDMLMEAARKKGVRGNIADTIDPQGPDTTPQHKYGDWRSMRGGCWYTGPMASRSASRAYGEAGDSFCYTGFRVAKD